MKRNNRFSLLLVLALLSVFGCKNFKDQMPEPEIKNVSSKQADLIKAFSGLGSNNKPSACNFIYTPEDIPKVLCRIVSEAKAGSEIVFLIDKTGSMDDDIDQVKKSINEIIDCLPPGCRLGAATYGDFYADGSDWFDIELLTEDYQLIRNYVNLISTTGGGDIAESVYDGIWEVLVQMPWKDCNAPDKIIVMGDAEPHTGLLTNHSQDEVIEKAQSICPNTEFYPVLILNL